MKLLSRAFLLLACVSFILIVASMFGGAIKENKRIAEIADVKINKVIILTYMRSGSSLTGDLLQQNPHVFYFYEPLWNIDHVYQEDPHKTLRFFNRTEISMMSPRDLWFQSLHAMKAVLNCNFTTMDTGSLSRAFIFNSKTTAPFQRCLEKQRQQRKLGRNRNGPRQILFYCVQQLSSNCSSHNTRVIKVIRADMNHAKQMMTTDPSVKIIHLIRDPKATLSSRMSNALNRLTPRQMGQYALDLCRQIEKDIYISKRLTFKDQGRILTIRYEDIVEAPVKATEQMYRFLGLRMTSRIKDYIWNITYAGHPDTCSTCTTRSNASITASAWRSKMTYRNVVLIDQICRKVMDTLGYRRLKSKVELRNLDFSTTREMGGSNIMTLNDVAN